MPALNSNTPPTSWNRVFLHSPHKQFFPNQDKEIAVRTAHSGYLWGSFVARKITPRTTHPNTSNSPYCNICNTGPNHPHHFFYNCPFTRRLITKLEKVLMLETKITTKLTKSAILFNETGRPKSQHLKITKLCSNTRKTLVETSTVPPCILPSILTHSQITLENTNQIQTVFRTDHRRRLMKCFSKMLF